MTIFCKKSSSEASVSSFKSVASVSVRSGCSPKLSGSSKWNPFEEMSFSWAVSLFSEASEEYPRLTSVNDNSAKAGTPQDSKRSSAASIFAVTLFAFMFFIPFIKCGIVGAVSDFLANTTLIIYENS